MFWLKFNQTEELLAQTYSLAYTKNLAQKEIRRFILVEKSNLWQQWEDIHAIKRFTLGEDF